MALHFFRKGVAIQLTIIALAFPESFLLRCGGKSNNANVGSCLSKEKEKKREAQRLNIAGAGTSLRIQTLNRRIIGTRWEKHHVFSIVVAKLPILRHSKPDYRNVFE